MIVLRVLPKMFLWSHYSGPQELGGPGSLNRLNPRFLRHWKFGDIGLFLDLYRDRSVRRHINTIASFSQHSAGLPHCFRFLYTPGLAASSNGFPKDKEEPLGIAGAIFLQTGCSSSLPTNSVRVLNIPAKCCTCRSCGLYVLFNNVQNVVLIVHSYCIIDGRVRLGLLFFLCCKRGIKVDSVGCRLHYVSRSPVVICWYSIFAIGLSRLRLEITRMTSSV